MLRVRGCAVSQAQERPPFPPSWGYGGAFALSSGTLFRISLFTRAPGLDKGAVLSIDFILITYEKVSIIIVGYIWGLFVMDADKTNAPLVGDLFIKEVNRYKKTLYFTRYSKYEEDIINHFCYLGVPFQYTKEALRLINSNNKRRVRCYDKIISLFRNYNSVYFGTLTFTDSVLSSTNQKTRRVYVSRFLKSISECYVANIDFGDKVKNPDSNEREHYHCLIAVDCKPCTWRYGFTKFKKVSISETSGTCLSKYIVKLSRHALKQSANKKAPRLIYSKVVAPSWLFD